MASTLITTVSRETGQVPFVLVHLNLFAPTLKPFTVEVGEDGETIVPVPATSDQEPLPVVIVFPANDDEELQIV